MEEIKTDVVIDEIIVDEPTKDESKTFTKEEVNNIVKSRVNKEREEIGKVLGVDAYLNADALNKYVSEINSNKTKLTELQSASETHNKTVEELTNEKYQYKYNIKEDSLEKALTLAKLEIDKDSTLTTDKALESVLAEFNNLTTGVLPTQTKIGSQTKNETKVDPNPYVSEQLAKSYPWLKK